MTNQSNQNKDLKFCQNFYSRKAASLTEEQKQELAKWEKEICGDGVALRPAVDKEFRRLLEILEKRNTDLQNLGKASLQECFMSNLTNQDKDFKFCQCLLHSLSHTFGLPGKADLFHTPPSGVGGRAL